MFCVCPVLVADFVGLDFGTLIIIGSKIDLEDVEVSGIFSSAVGWVFDFSLPVSVGAGASLPAGSAFAVSVGGGSEVFSELCLVFSDVSAGVSTG